MSVPRGTLTSPMGRGGALARYADLLRASPHNLLSPRALAELEERHLPESVALAEMVPERARRLLDVGSGGGLPGVVIAICRPDLDVVLLEATAKKAAFLTEAVAQLGLSSRVVTERAEVAARGPLAGTFDVVTARAVAPLARLVPWTVPFLAPDGRVYAVKGARWRQELPDAQLVLRRYGVRIVGSPDGHPHIGGGVRSAQPRVVMLGRS